MDGNQTGYWLANSFLPISVFCEVKKLPSHLFSQKMYFLLPRDDYVFVQSHNEPL